MSSQAVLRQFDPSSLMREPVRAKSSYVPSPRDESRSDSVVRLDMNESPYGPSPKAQAAIAAFVTTHRYPDFDQWALRDAIATYTGTTAEQVFCGAGCDDVLNMMAQAVLEPGDEIIISEPTFGVYRMQANLRGAKTVNVPLTSDFQLDAAGVLVRSPTKPNTSSSARRTIPRATSFSLPIFSGSSTRHPVSYSSTRRTRNSRAHRMSTSSTSMQTCWSFAR